MILGEPGSGKTTMLLELARSLIVRAEEDPGEPVPVVLYLSSWTGEYQSFKKWMIHELNEKYLIPKKMGSAWISEDKLLLLLDGFDEIKPANRKSCIEAVNHFCRKCQAGMVICGRIEEYNAIDTRLDLNAAILLQPLTPRQVDNYLVAGGQKLKAIHTVVQRDSALKELVSSPLMLKILILAYEGMAVESLSGFNSIEARRQHLFDVYVQRMFERRRAASQYFEIQTRRWLSWLAQQLIQHNQTLFLIERLQPSWLPSRGWRWVYLSTSSLIIGLFAGAIMWVYFLWLRQIVDWPIVVTLKLSQTLGLGQELAEILTIGIGNLLLSLLVGLIHGLYFELRPAQIGAGGEGSRPGWGQVITVGLVVGIITTGFLGIIIASDTALADYFWLAWAWGITESMLFMTTTRYVHGWSYDTEIRTVEALRWSWRSAAKGLAFSLLLALAAERIQSMVVIINDAFLTTILTFGLGGLLLGGMRGRRVRVTNRPNEGIWLSFKNAAVLGLTSGLSLWLVTWWLRRNELIGFFVAILTGVFIALVAALLFGGINVTKHFLIRFFLWNQGRLPGRYAHFLDYADKLIFLRKVGGGYIFIHRTLMEYFAELEHEL